MAKGRIEIYPGRRDTLWYWRLRHKNGHIVCDGSEGYASKSNAKRAVRRIIFTMALAPIEEVQNYG